MNVSVKVPFDELMEVIERYLQEKGLVHKNEFIVMADIGLSVDDNDMVDIDLEVDVEPDPLPLARELPVEEIEFNDTVIDLSTYKERKKAQLSLPFKDDEDVTNVL